MDAVAGGTSVRRAIGSALRKRSPLREVISNLYRASSPTPGRNSSHTPDDPSDRIGKAVPSQELNSPATRTPWAFGAHTVKRVPVTPPCVIGSGPGAVHTPPS